MRAVVDIGSNSVKFSAARGPGTEIAVSGSWVTRLGAGSAQRRLLPESVAKTRQALIEIRTRLEKAAGSLNAVDIKVVATSAVRDAENPEEVIMAVSEILGAPLRVLSGLEEARASMEGAASAAETVFGHRECLFFDMGGASTEVGMIWPRFSAHSFQAGAVRCHEAFGFGKDAVSDAAWAEAERDVRDFFPADEWDPLISSFASPPRAAVVVGGTLVLASRLIDTARDAMPVGRVVSLESVRELGERLRRMSVESRFLIPHMVEGRADVVVTGLLLLKHLLERAKLEEVLVTEWGLRHGILRNWSLA